MKSILLTAAFLLISCITSNAQIIAGQVGPIDVLEKANSYMTIGGFGTENFPLDIDFDGQNEFQFEIFYSQMGGYPISSICGCNIYSLCDWKIATDTFLCNPGSSSIICSASFPEGSPIHLFSKWGSSGCLFYNSLNSPDPSYDCYITPFDTVAYVGIKKETSNDTIYGWIKIHSLCCAITLYSYAFNKETTGMSEANSNNYFSIFPNPASDKINISCSMAGDYLYTLRDLQGSSVISGSFNGGGHSVDLNNLKPGMYFLSLQQGDKIAYKKFLKE